MLHMQSGRTSLTYSCSIISSCTFWSLLTNCALYKDTKKTPWSWHALPRTRQQGLTDRLNITRSSKKLDLLCHLWALEGQRYLSLLAFPEDLEGRRHRVHQEDQDYPGGTNRTGLLHQFNYTQRMNMLYYFLFDIQAAVKWSWSLSKCVYSITSKFEFEAVLHKFRSTFSRRKCAERGEGSHESRWKLAN